MDPYLAELAAHLAKSPPKDADAESLLEMLFFCYAEQHPIRSHEISRFYRQHDFILRRLPFQEFDEICVLTNALCYEYERAAFLAGLRTGVRLAGELASDLP